MMHFEMERYRGWEKNRNATRWRNKTRFSENIQFSLFSFEPFVIQNKLCAVGCIYWCCCCYCCNSGQYGWVDEKWDGFYLKCDTTIHSHTRFRFLLFACSMLFFFWCALLFHFYSFWIYVKRKWWRFFTTNSLFFANQAHFALNHQEKGIYDFQHK